MSRRHLRSNNSWLHNVGPLMKSKDRCTLLMHDDDARCVLSPPTFIDEPSGNGALNGIPVTVTPVRT